MSEGDANDAFDADDADDARESGIKRTGEWEARFHWSSLWAGS